MLQARPRAFAGAAPRKGLSPRQAIENLPSARKTAVPSTAAHGSKPLGRYGESGLSVTRKCVRSQDPLNGEYSAKQIAGRTSVPQPPYCTSWGEHRATCAE